MKFIFDNYPNEIGAVVIDNDSLCVIINGESSTVISASLDQWGTFYFLNNLTISQESGSRSFLDALIKGLVEFRHHTEHITFDADTKEN